VAGAFAIGAVIQPDITRYAKGKGHAAGGMIFGMGIGFPLVLILAAFLGAASGQSDFATIMLAFHRGVWAFFAMFVIVFATWTTNDNKVALASENIRGEMEKHIKVLKRAKKFEEAARLQRNERGNHQRDGRERGHGPMARPEDHPLSGEGAREGGRSGAGHPRAPDACAGPGRGARRWTARR